MDNLVNSIDGFNTWQYAVITVLSLIIGMSFAVSNASLKYKLMSLPIYIFGLLLTYLWITNWYDDSVITNSAKAGLASTVPVVTLVTLFYCYGNAILYKSNEEDTDIDDKEKTND